MTCVYLCAFTHWHVSHWTSMEWRQFNVHFYSCMWFSDAMLESLAGRHIGWGGSGYKLHFQLHKCHRPQKVTICIWCYRVILFWTYHTHMHTFDATLVTFLLVHLMSTGYAGGFATRPLHAHWICYHRGFRLLHESRSIGWANAWSSETRNKHVDKQPIWHLTHMKQKHVFSFLTHWHCDAFSEQIKNNKNISVQYIFNEFQGWNLHDAIMPAANKTRGHSRGFHPGGLSMLRHPGRWEVSLPSLQILRLFKTIWSRHVVKQASCEPNLGEHRKGSPKEVLVHVMHAS